MRHRLALPLSIALSVAPFACGGGGDDPLDAEDSPFPDGKGDGGIDEGSPEALAVLALVNDRSVDVAELDHDAGLNGTAAKNIIAHRDGADGDADTTDDDPFDSLAELDAVKFVGPTALEALLDHAVDQGLLPGDAAISVIFSPQPKASSHTARLAQLIGQAQTSVDIAIYSFSDADISDALEDAVDRGVKVRFIFETANEDEDLPETDRDTSSSGRLESRGVDVRFVNKIMHHKFALIDGPRDDAARAGTATLVTGSGNWNNSGATSFDENTFFIEGHAELNASFQREFDLMWSHSKDFTAGEDFDFEQSTSDLRSGVADDPGAAALLTSTNFTVADGSTTFRTDKSSTDVVDEWVKGIESATESIHIASGHLRLKPIAEALIAAHEAHPDLDIQVYLDQQEYISASGDAFQAQEVEDCLADATTDSQRFDCENKEFLWSKQLVDAGIELRYKVYSYRWDHSYAVQMHHKYMVIDGDELFSGSYNLSMNAEHGTFENSLHLAGPSFASIIGQFEANFDAIFRTGDGGLDDLRDDIATLDTIPIVFDSIAVTWQQYTDLRTLFRANCTQIDSDEFRQNAAAHKVCERP
ncbi:MAG TPA: phospholipase D-like domain-containing protein [Kofleriaceae bacterium]|nr:phospholipase D-like domain-containing protein [Kofleriaceae bacterium]